MRVTQPNGKSLYSWGYGCSFDDGEQFRAGHEGRQLPGGTTARVPR